MVTIYAFEFVGGERIHQYTDDHNEAIRLQSALQKTTGKAVSITEACDCISNDLNPYYGKIMSTAASIKSLIEEMKVAKEEYSIIFKIGGDTSVMCDRLQSLYNEYDSLVKSIDRRIDLCNELQRHMDDALDFVSIVDPKYTNWGNTVKIHVGEYRIFVKFDDVDKLSVGTEYDKLTQINDPNDIPNSNNMPESCRIVIEKLAKIYFGEEDIDDVDADREVDDNYVKVSKILANWDWRF